MSTLGETLVIPQNGLKVTACLPGENFLISEIIRTIIFTSCCILIGHLFPAIDGADQDTTGQPLHCSPGADAAYL